MKSQSKIADDTPSPNSNLTTPAKQSTDASGSQLFISPERVIFKRSERKKQLVIYNTGNKTIKYHIKNCTNNSSKP